MTAAGVYGTSSNTYTPVGPFSVAFSTSGKFVLTGTGNSLWYFQDITSFSFTGTSRVECTNISSTTYRSIQHGGIAGAAEAKSISFYIDCGTVATYLSVIGAVRDLSITSLNGYISHSGDYAGTLPLQIYGNTVIPANITYLSGPGLSFQASSGTQTLTVAAPSCLIGIALFKDGAGTLEFLSDMVTAVPNFTHRLGTLKLKASTTFTVNSFITEGSTLKYLISSTTGTRATLSKSSGTVDVTYLSVKDISTTGGATFNAFTTNGNVDAGNNLGWNFTPPPVTYNPNMFLMFG